MTLSPHACADLDVLSAAVQGCTGLGALVHSGCLYLHVKNAGERLLVDVTHGGVVLWGREYAAIMHAATEAYGRAAVSLATLGLAPAVTATVSASAEVPTPGDPDRTIMDAIPALEDTAPLPVTSEAAAPLAFDLPERMTRQRKVLGADDVPPLPSFFERVSGSVRPKHREVVEGWGDE